MHCLVTGASGFIGRALSVYLIGEGHRVTGLFRNATHGAWDKHYLLELGVESIPMELLSDVDVIYHLAGVAHDVKDSEYSESDYYRINTEASIELAHLAALSGVQHFIYFSSVKAVADPGDQCVDESWDMYPTDAYGVSKRKAEELLLELYEDCQCPVTILRPVLVYGPGVKGNLEQMIKVVRSGYFPLLPDTGNKRSLIHIDDLIEAVDQITFNQQAYGKIYILSGPAPYSTRLIYESLCKSFDVAVSKKCVPKILLTIVAKIGDIYESLTGHRCPINSNVINKLLGSACFQSTKIKDEVGWEATRILDDSMQKIVDRRN